MAISPELIQQLIWIVSPQSPGGQMITAREFQQIMGTLTSIVMAGLAGVLVGAVAGKFAREMPVPLIFTDTGAQIEATADRELWLELMEAFEEARSRAYKRTYRR